MFSWRRPEAYTTNTEEFYKYIYIAQNVTPCSWPHSLRETLRLAMSSPLGNIEIVISSDFWRIDLSLVVVVVAAAVVVAAVVAVVVEEVS